MTAKLPPPREACTCAESRYTDLQGIERIIRHPLHDCQYVKERNALIPIATRHATKQDRLNTADFIAAMDALWAVHANHR